MRTAATVSSMLTSAVAVACLFSGCASNPDKTDFNSIKGDLSPEMQTLSERPSDVDRNIATTSNQDGRMFWMDLGRAFYLDRPSSLSPYFIVPTGGQPR